MKTWSQIAVEFTQSLRRFGVETVGEAYAAPPLSESQIQSLEDALEIFIPDSLRDFLEMDSASCRCKYYMANAKRTETSLVPTSGTELQNQLALANMYGGAKICNSEHFATWNSDSLKSVFDFDKELSEICRTHSSLHLSETAIS